VGSEVAVEVAAVASAVEAAVGSVVPVPEVLVGIVETGSLIARSFQDAARATVERRKERWALITRPAPREERLPALSVATSPTLPSPSIRSTALIDPLYSIVRRLGNSRLITRHSGSKPLQRLGYPSQRLARSE
jgi:hypothetical protein